MSFVVIKDCLINRTLIVAVHVDKKEDVYKIYLEKECIEGNMYKDSDIISQFENMFKNDEKNDDYFVRFCDTWINIKNLKYIKYAGFNDTFNISVYNVFLLNCKQEKINVLIYRDMPEYRYGSGEIVAKIHKEILNHYSKKSK
jgi:hypothetical protein